MRSSEETLQGLAEVLSLRRRVRYLVQLFGAGTVAVLVGVLWWSEDGLPVRTQVGFAVVVGVGLGWAVYAGWALWRGGRLFAVDRVIAGWLALGFAVLLAAGLAVMGLWPVGGVVVVGAIGFLYRAHAVRRRLERRYLERR